MFYLAGIFRTLVTSLVTQMVKCLAAMRETPVRSLGQEDPLEKEMATHSIPLPGKSNGQRSPLGYSPWGSRVGHEFSSDGVNKLVLMFVMNWY